MTRKSQYGWMVVGGILCLCGGVVALKLREGNPAIAQVERTGLCQASHVDDPPPASPPHAPGEMKPLADPTEPLPPILHSGETAAPDHPADPAIGTPPTITGPTAPPPAVKIELPPSPVAEGPPPPLAGPPSAPPDAAPPSDPLPTPEAKNVQPLPPPVPVGPTAPPGSIDPPPPAPPIVAPTVTRPEVVKVTAPTILQVGEPPLAGTGPMQAYQVRATGETMRDIARRTLGAGERCTDVYKLNPALRPEDSLAAGTLVHLPPDACLPVEEVEGLKPLPAMRPKTAPAKPRTVMALTGTYPCNIDDKRSITLPRAVREQFADADQLLVSPGPDQCLWLTDPAHQERLAERLEHSPAREIDVRVFKRLYYAQTEKVMVGPDGRVAISDRLTQFAGLSQEVVLVGIDDHFEIWDAARWKQYTQAKSAAAAGSE